MICCPYNNTIKKANTIKGPKGIGSFLVFINVGLALWLGEILGEAYYGFFAGGAFYGLITIIFSLFMNKWVKRVFYDYFVRKIIKSDKE